MASQITRTPIGANTPATSAAMNIELDRIVDAYNSLTDEHNTQQTSIDALIAALGGAQFGPIRGHKLDWVDADTIGFSCDIVSLQNVNDASDWIIVSGPTFTDIDITDVTGSYTDNILPVGTIASRVADTWYYVWATTDSSGASPTLYYSLNDDYATVKGEVPADTAYIRRVGSVFVLNPHTNGFREFYNGRGSGVIEYATEVTMATELDGSWHGTTWRSIDFVDAAPPTCTSVKGQVNALMTHNNGSIDTSSMTLNLSHDAAGAANWPIVTLAGFGDTGLGGPQTVKALNDFDLTFPDASLAVLAYYTTTNTQGASLTAGSWTVSCRGYEDAI